MRNPIFKTGLKIETCNYRGITVLPIFEKIFEIAAQKRLECVSEAFRKNDRYNGGFLRGSRTTDNLYILNGLIERQLSTGQSLIVCHVDFTQAFDRVNRNILFYKIKKSGLTGRVIDTLQNLYTKTRFGVKCNGEISDIVRENLGVNQDGNASTILFRRYLSDIKEYLDEYTGICTSNEIILHMLWADDLYMVSSRPDHTQRQLDGLSKFCATNQMIANEAKTKCMTFGKEKHVSLKLNGKPLEQVQYYKCLGNIVSGTKTVMGDVFRENYGYLCDKARQSAFAMLNKVKNLSLPPRCIFHMYQSLIQPILLYGSDVCGMNITAQKSLDKVFHWFLKVIFHVKQSTSNVMLVGEVGMFPPSMLCHRNTLLYFVRLNNLPQGSVLKSIFLESKRLSDLGHRSWYSKVWELTQSYDLDINSYDDSGATKHMIKSVITGKYISDWYKKLQDVINNPILRIYKRLKHEFKYEDCMDCVRNPKYRKALTKFRTSSHTLEVERGRHTNPTTPVEQRNCNVCHVFEDECHFLLCCHIFADERHDFLRRIQNKYPNFATLDHMEKFTFLMQNKDAQVITWTAKFIYHAMDRRNNQAHRQRDDIR